MPPSTLTPSDIDHLRTNRLPRDGGHHGAASTGAPYILARPTLPGSLDIRLTLYLNGDPVTWSPHPGLLGALLIGEVLEPGYIARVLDPMEDAELAAADPQLAAVRRARAASEAAKARLAAEALEAAQQRRRDALRVDIPTLSLDDLFS